MHSSNSVHVHIWRERPEVITGFEIFILHLLCISHLTLRTAVCIRLLRCHYMGSEISNFTDHVTLLFVFYGQFNWTSEINALLLLPYTSVNENSFLSVYTYWSVPMLNCLFKVIVFKVKLIVFRSYCLYLRSNSYRSTVSLSLFI